VSFGAITVPLVTVELGYHDHFDLTAATSDILVRVAATNVLWQKQRPLNL
jgi:hypothetical protein